MYAILEVKSNIRVPPNLFGTDLKKAVETTINKDFVGILREDGLLLSLIDILDVGEGSIVPGDGAVYYETTFKMLAFKPMLQEVVQGVISEVTEFGVFVRLGPIDGLVHVSQVMDDYVNYAASGVLTGQQSKRTLKLKDTVIARIIALSLKSAKGSKIGLTMRQPGLGKIEWLEAEKSAEESKDDKPVETKKKAAGKKKTKTKK